MNCHTVKDPNTSIRNSRFDSYSGYFEQFKKWFATHGIPKEFHSENAVYCSIEFQKFAKDSNFKLITSSPIFAMSNESAENYVGIAKNLVKKCGLTHEDLQMSLLLVKNTPRNNNIGITTYHMLLIY